jgi:NADH:ubiquinone oxidoreductase subunit
MRMKMNKLSNKPLLVGRDQFGNRYFEDSTESFGRNRWVEYARPNKFGGLDPGGAHDGTTDHGFDGESASYSYACTPRPAGCPSPRATTLCAH